jgi:hypothetical protein
MARRLFKNISINIAAEATPLSPRKTIHHQTRNDYLSSSYGSYEGYLLSKNRQSACLQGYYFSPQKTRFKIARQFHFPEPERQKQPCCKEHKQRTLNPPLARYLFSQKMIYIRNRFKQNQYLWRQNGDTNFRRILTFCGSWEEWL